MELREDARADGRAGCALHAPVVGRREPNAALDHPERRAANRGELPLSCRCARHCRLATLGPPPAARRRRESAERHALLGALHDALRQVPQLERRDGCGVDGVVWVTMRLEKFHFLRIVGKALRALLQWPLRQSSM